MAGVDKPLDDLAIIEFAAGDQLKQSESGAVKRIVARAGKRSGEARDLGIKRGLAIGVGCRFPLSVIADIGQRNCTFGN